MLLCQSLAFFVRANMSKARSLHQRKTRRSTPVLPERRMYLPADSSTPPRILMKSFWAIHKLESDLKQNGPPDQGDGFLSKWKYAKRE